MILTMKYFEPQYRDFPHYKPAYSVNNGYVWVNSAQLIPEPYLGSTEAIPAAPFVLKATDLGYCFQHGMHLFT